MTSEDQPSEVSQTVTSGASPVAVALRTADDTVPSTVSEYEIDHAVISETASAAGEVALQNFDDDNTTVASAATYNIDADGTIEPGADQEDAVLSVPRGNQIRVDAGTDVEVMLYLVAADL